MTDPYREHIQKIEESSIPKNTYRYVLREDDYCPICKEQIKTRILSLDGRYCDNPRYRLCHPLKRISVKGMWWWRKYCPVEGVHHHITCNECKVSWITMASDQSEANPDIKDAYI